MRYANPPAGGAERSMLNLAKILMREGHSIKIISLGYKNKNSFFEGVPITEINFRPKIIEGPIAFREIDKFIKLNILELGLEEKITDFSPELVFVQHEMSFFLQKLKMEKKLKAPLILFIHGFEYINMHLKPYLLPTKENLIEEAAKKILGKYTESLIRDLIKYVDLIIFPSKYLEKIYKSKFNIKNSEVIYPFIQINKFLKLRKNNKRKYILHIKPTIQKGIEITLFLAKKFKHKKFVIIGKIENPKILQQAKSLHNVKILGYQKNMAKIYRKTQLLLIPTLQPETFSISSIEAQCSGCNVLATGVGGVNAPFKALIRDNKNINKWEKYFIKRGSKLPIKNLKKFDCTLQYKNLKNLIQIK